MQQPILSDNREETHTPSLRFVCSIAHLLQSDPTDMLRELVYSRPETGTEARSEDSPLPPSQEKNSEFSEYYLG